MSLGLAVLSNGAIAKSASPPIADTTLPLRCTKRSHSD
jgi:hypothetical protein